MPHHLVDTLTLAFIPNIGPFELTALALLGLLIFGKRLPEVGKSIGRGIVEFKRGLSGIDDDLDLKQPPKIEQHRAEQTDAPNSSPSEASEPGDPSRARPSA